MVSLWTDACRDAVGRFPDYPTEEEGGSLMIFKEKDPAEVEAALKALVSLSELRLLIYSAVIAIHHYGRPMESA